MGVPISDPIFRSNFRSNFPFQFFNAFRCRGAPQKIGSKNWKQNWIIKLIRKLEAKALPIFRSNFSLQLPRPCRRGGGPGRQPTNSRAPGDSEPQPAVQKAARPRRRLVSGGPQIRCIRFFSATKQIGLSCEGVRYAVLFCDDICICTYIHI